MENDIAIENFLKELTRLIEEDTDKMKRLKTVLEEIQYVQGLLDVLRISKLAFAEGVVNLSKEKEKEFLDNVRKCCPKELLDDVFRQCFNLYSLQNAGLLQFSEFTPQKDLAEEVISSFEEKLQEYMKKVNKKSCQTKHDSLMEHAEKCTKFGSLFSNMLEDEVDDLDFFETVLSEVHLSDSMKMTIIQQSLLHNVGLYRKSLFERENNHQKTDNNNDAFYEEIEKLQEYLSSSDNRMKIIYALTGEEVFDEDALDAITLAREEIERMIRGDKLSFEDALKRFFEENNYSYERAKEVLLKLSKEQEPVEMDEDSLSGIIEEARGFCDKRKSLIYDKKVSDKEVLNNYIDGLYNHMENRISIYKNKSINSDFTSIIGDAAYEINCFLNYIDCLDKDKDHNLILVAAKRIQEVFDSLNTVLEDKERDFIPKDESVHHESSLYYLMKNQEKTFLEDDVRLEAHSKGISNAYYKEIIQNLVSIQENGNDYSSSILGKWKYLHKFGVKCKESFHTNIFYLPVGDDFIILGVGIHGHEDSFQKIDDRLRQYESLLEELIQKINTGDIKNRDEIHKRIISLLSQEKQKSFGEQDEILDEMFGEDVSTQEETSSKKM